MPQPTKKRGRPRTQPMECYVFEIGEWKPSYILSVNRQRDRTGAFYEHIDIEIQTLCIYPKKLAGRSAQFTLSGQRNCLTPTAYQRDPDWIPNCVGLLELPPTRGRFYTAVPHESLSALITPLIHRLFHFVLLFGPPLSRGASLCSSMQFEQTVDLEDY